MEEKAVYICSFLSINSEVFPPLTAEEAAETSTERLVANCISNGKLRFQLGYCTALQPYDCGDLALFALVYDLDIQDNPALAELERREDAVTELLLFSSHTSNAETSKLAMSSPHPLSYPRLTLSCWIHFIRKPAPICGSLRPGRMHRNCWKNIWKAVGISIILFFTERNFCSPMVSTPHNFEKSVGFFENGCIYK